MAGWCHSPFLESKLTSAIGTVDFIFLTHVEENPWMTCRAATTVAAHLPAGHFNFFRWFHVVRHSLSMTENLAG